MSHPFFDVERPVVIGHRGSAGTRPENTLLSFEAALASGAQILESDIHVTRDGVPVLLHDPGLERTTDGRGDACEHAWSSIRKFDAGLHFESEDGERPYGGQNVRVPSLEEAFDRFPEARFNLEIKSPGVEGIRATLELVERFERAERTLLAAGENEIMRDLRAELTTHEIRPATGASLAEIVASVSSALEGSPMPEGVMALQIPADFAGRPLATREFIDHAHAHGVEVHVWTINDLGEIEGLIDLGVDGIVTDHPGRMSEWLGRDGRR
jgi:glycerophosphoryl diester phosphodiesterase